MTIDTLMRFAFIIMIAALICAVGCLVADPLAKFADRVVEDWRNWRRIVKRRVS